MTAQSMRDILLEAAKLAGNVHKMVYATDFKVFHKYENEDVASSVYTLADTESEKALREFFARNLPDYNVFGEEQGAPSYDGNGKVIILDPLDGTKRFVERREQFGPIIGVYHDGRNVAGVEYNTLLDEMYLATEEAGFECLGDAGSIEGVIIAGNRVFHGSLLPRIRQAVQEAFPLFTVDVEGNNVNRGRVCSGRLKGYVHLNLGIHDIAAIPVLAEKSGTFATDLDRNPYGTVDIQSVVADYRDGSARRMYHREIVVAKAGVYNILMKVLGSFREEIAGIRKSI